MRATRTNSRRKLIAWTSTIVVVLSLFCTLFTPYLLAEIFAFERRGQPRIVETAEVKDLQDGYWSISEIAPSVFAIGEPLYYQNNWSYLIVGQDRALLFDTGPGVRDISIITARLTDRPVYAMASHLHFDHIGGLSEFDKTVMLDTPSVRARAGGDKVEPSRYQHLGFVDGVDYKSISVSRWIKPGETFDLGDRVLTILSAPGHTADSAVVIDPTKGLMFTGDFLYRGPLYAMLPGASRSAYLETATHLLEVAPEDIAIYGAHAPGQQAVPPVLNLGTLKRLRRQLEAVQSGDLVYEGILPRQIEIDKDINFLTGLPFHNK